MLFVPAAPTASGLFRTAMALRLEPALIQRTGNRLDVIAAYAIGTVAVTTTDVGATTRILEPMFTDTHKYCYVRGVSVAMRI